MEIVVGRNKNVIKKSLFIDEEDHPKILQFGSIFNVTSHGYARVLKAIGGGKYKQEYVHRIVMDAPNHLQVDHINGNRLDCRKENLRLCTDKGNSKNKGAFSGKYKGVHFNKQIKRWVAQITKNYKCQHIGCFKTEEEAALAYNKMAKKLHGKYAFINIIE